MNTKTTQKELFSLFPKGWRNKEGKAVLATKPQQVQSIGWVGEYIKSERARWATEELRRLIEKAETGGLDDKGKKELSDFKKLNFEVATFAGVFSYRNAKSLVERSPFMVLDIDDLPSLDEARRVQNLLINDRFVETVLCFVSPSGHGVKAVVRQPEWVQNCDFKTAFQMLSLHVGFQYGIVVDKSGSDVCRACFLPWDPECFINFNYYNQ
jgi:hypothetical protein